MKAIEPAKRGLLIGQLAKITGVNPDAIRFYERGGLMKKPQRLAGGYRSYDDSALKRLRFIKRAQSLDFSLGEIKRILGLRESGRLPCDYVIQLADLRLRKTERDLAELTKFRDLLRDYIRHWKRTANPKACAATDFCSLIEELDGETTNKPKNRLGRDANAFLKHALK